MALLYYLLQVITLSLCVAEYIYSYIFEAIFYKYMCQPQYVLKYYWLYFLSTCFLQLKYNWWNYHRYTIVCCNTRSCKVACSTIWGYSINKKYYYINVVCNQTVLHWGTNEECIFNQGNTIWYIWYNWYIGYSWYIYSVYGTYGTSGTHGTYGTAATYIVQLVQLVNMVQIGHVMAQLTGIVVINLQLVSIW